MTYQTFVAMGDSLIAGVGDSLPNLELISFADRFAETLKQAAPDLTYTNLAVGGTTSTLLIKDQLPKALELKPDLLLIGTGANDTVRGKWRVEQTRKNLEKVLDRFSPEETTIVLMTYVDGATVMQGAAAEWVEQTRPRLEQLCEMIRELSRERGLLCADFWELTATFQAAEWSKDGVHPNAQGHIKGAQHMIRIFSEHTGLNLLPSEI